MTRKKTSIDDILKSSQDKLPEIYSQAMVNEVGTAILETIIESYQRGDVVNFGLGNSYLKLRKNNTNFSPAKTHSIVFRGDVCREISEDLIDLAMKDKDLYDLFYTRRGKKEED